MKRSHVLTCGLVAWIGLAAASLANAGEVMFSIRGGRVTIVARNAPISDILAIWEKEGRTKIVAREKVAGTVTSLDILDQPESVALAIVLRNVSGYLAVKNPDAALDASMYRCIVISPAPAPVMVAQSGPSTPAPIRSGPMGFQNPQFVVPLPDDGDEPGATRPVVQNPGMPGYAAVGGSLGRPPADAQPPADASGRTPSPATTPGSPAGGSLMPGTVAPAKPPAVGPIK